LLFCQTQLGVKFIPKNTYPLLNAMLIYKDEIWKIENYLNGKSELENASSDYDRFYIETKNVKPNVNIPRTLEAYDNFIIKRFRENQTGYVYTNLVNLYVVMVPMLQKEIMRYTTDELTELLEAIPQQVAQREFTNFIDYCKKRYVSKSKERIKLGTTKGKGNEAYTFEQWLEFARLLFSPNQELLKKAITNRTNAMVWLYSALHYVCGWRTDDLIKLPFPPLENVLGLNEEEVFECIQTGEFTLEMAQRVVNYVMLEVKAFHIKPRKTRRKHNQRLKFVVNDDYVYIIGLLIALCEAHRVKVEKSKHRWLNSSTILTERVTKRETHIEFFGEAYNHIFGNETFSNNSATKTYFNWNQKLSQDEGWGMGYEINAILRGHYRGKDGIAQTTQVYLKYINKSNDVDKITEGLLARGVFGFSKHLLMKALLHEDEYREYTVLQLTQQNQAIQEMFNLKPFHIEQMVKGITEYRGRVLEVFQQLMTTHKGQMKEIFKKISMGEAPSKMEHSQCLLKTVSRSACAYPTREHCIGCEYAMNEMYFLIEFGQRFKQLLNNLRNAKHDFDKQRYTYALFYVYLPIFQEAVSYFGKERVGTFVKVAKQEINELRENNQLLFGEGENNVS
ncbi:hypothetical protein P4V33_26670, partial [Brevibacillus borstelensis]|nr:hypothetical protein [Brevibacillus borstelensis]